MRIAVVGATGNAGTAVLRELASRDNVESILGIARRIPDEETEPYKYAAWESVDIQFSASRAELAEMFSGYDAVIHLAWLIQPNTKRDLLRRVNVDGTRYVLEAAAQAGVKTVVVASSVGAYSPVDDDVLRDESWPTGGIAGSHYSVDKAAQERVMDEFETNYPEVRVARIRAALKFQGSAGSEIQRYFLGSWVPVQLLRYARPPIIPFPKGARTQAVHTDDVARAYVEAALQGAHGAFNICADDILDAQTIGGVVTRNPKFGRVLPVPAKPLRPLLKAAHRSGLLAMDEGWLDMGVQVPLMDNSRAKQELGWAPRISGAEALDELIRGMDAGDGTASAPMRARGGTPVAESWLPSKDHRVPDDVDAMALRQYMADHVAGATAGLKRIEKLSEAFMKSAVYEDLAAVAEQIRAEQNFLQALMVRQNFARPGIAGPALWAGERVARLKSYFPEGLKITPSVLVLETELMLSAVTGKLHGWRTMLNESEALGVSEEVFQQLVDDAQEQYGLLERVHKYARERAFAEDRETDVEDGLAKA